MIVRAAIMLAALAGIPAPKLGEPVVLAFDAVDGRHVDLAALRGRVVLVAFWASWCGPCKTEAAELKRAWERHHEQGLEIVGLSFDRQREALTYFIEKQALPWPQHFDGDARGNRLARGLGVDRIPALWLVDRRGRLRDGDAAHDLAAKLDAALGDKTTIDD
jgi:peroxiredoxin